MALLRASWFRWPPAWLLLARYSLGRPRHCQPVGRPRRNAWQCHRG
jgi:hypothetical protein